MAFLPCLEHNLNELKEKHYLEMFLSHKIKLGKTLFDKCFGEKVMVSYKQP
jgi:hypothetical protein